MTDTIAIAGTETFTLRFDAIDKDMDRLMEHVAVLVHAGRLESIPGKSLNDVYLTPANARIIDAYWQRGLFAAVEQHYTYTFDIAFGWPHHGMLHYLERFVAAGEGSRSIRIMRNYLALQKSPFWSRINDRKRGFHIAKYWAASEAEQREAYTQLIAPIAEYRDALLKLMDFSRDLFVRAGATEAQLARLAIERAEVAAEQRTPPGKADPRKMDEDVFWEIIGTPADGALSERIDALPDRLAAFKATQIKAFDAVLHDINYRAYRHDIWTLAYLLQDGCSDDSFEAFRAGLIMLGQQAFAAVLADPDRVDPAVDVGNGLSLMDVSPLAYEMRHGTGMKRKIFKAPQLGGTVLDEAAFAAALPRVAARV